MSASMRGEERQQSKLFSYVSPEQRIPPTHPIRTIRQLVDRALQTLSPQFDGLYAAGGRPSIPPEQLLRALLLQVLFTVRSERQLMERIDYDMMFRWFVGLELDVVAEVLRIRRAALPRGHWETALAETLEGELLAGLGRPAEAESLLVRGYDIVRQAQPAGSRNRTEARERLVRFYRWRGQPQRAAAVAP